MSYSPTDFLKTARQVAEHFGFREAEQLKKETECKECTVTLPHSVTGLNKRVDEQNGLLSSGLVTYCEDQLHAFDRPVLFYSIAQTPRTGEAAVIFHVFNAEKSIAEALLIQTARALATDLGHTEHSVRINSLGDRDSVARYTRELTNFLKKRMDTMSSEARELMKEHPLRALSQLIKENHELAQRSPNPLEYLSDPSRKHFREIIEFLDMSDTPYEIDPKMMAHHECYSDAIFSIDLLGEDEPPLTIQGGRFDEFVHRNTHARTPAAGVVVTLKNSKTPARLPRIKSITPAVYVVHLGFGPKIRSLLLIDALKQAGVPVFHDLTSDSLSAQLRDAENKGVKYSIIIGQKEFVEDTVILRDMDARNQEFVNMHEAVKRLRRKSSVTL